MIFLKHVKSLGLVSLFICLMLSAGPNQAPETMQRFEDFAIQAMKTHHVPGCSIAIVKDNEIFYAKGFGYRDVENKKLVDPETIFPIASCTKAFTATALGKLVDQEKLDWDTPIKTYLSNFAMYDKEATEKLSIRDCLCHRSGLPDHGYDDFLVNPLNPFRFKSGGELVSNLQYLKPNAKFREKWQYNNMMYALAGYVLEIVSGMPWNVFVKENITKPLGMKNTYFSSSDVQEHQNAALGYEFESPSQSFKYVDYDDRGISSPAGAILSSAVDMAQWVIANLQGTGINKEIYKPQILIEQSAHSYCLGWLKTSDNHFWHSGNLNGCSAVVDFIPKEHIGLVILSNINVDTNGFHELLTQYTYACMTNNEEKILELEKVEPQKADDTSYKQMPEKKNKITPSISMPQANQFVGTYHNNMLGEIFITFNGSYLETSITCLSQTFAIECIDQDTFKEIDKDGDDQGLCTFCFKRNNSETVTSFETEIGKNCPFEFVKV